MKEHEHENGNRAIKLTIGNIIWRWGVGFLMLIASAAGSYAVLWIKANAPTRTEFQALTENVSKIRDDLRGMPNYDKELKIIDTRLQWLEKWNEHRFPPKKEP